MNARLQAARPRPNKAGLRRKRVRPVPQARLVNHSDPLRTVLKAARAARTPAPHPARLGRSRVRRPAVSRLSDQRTSRAPGQGENQAPNPAAHPALRATERPPPRRLRLREVIRAAQPARLRPPSDRSRNRPRPKPQNAAPPLPRNRVLHLLHQHQQQARTARRGMARSRHPAEAQPCMKVAVSTGSAARTDRRCQAQGLRQKAPATRMACRGFFLMKLTHQITAEWITRNLARQDPVALDQTLPDQTISCSSVTRPWRSAMRSSSTSLLTPTFS